MIHFDHHASRRLRTVVPILAVCAGCLPISYAVEVDIHVNVKHTVGGVSTFDRSKFITIHSSHTDNEWDGGQQGAPNFTSDLLADFILGNDVYFGRDTGYISWYLRNNIDENPVKSGWARESGSTFSLATQGSNARNSYNGATDLHPYESRASSGIMAAQYQTFWPGSGNTSRGWGLSQADTAAEPFGSATGNYMGHFLNHFYGSGSQVGLPLPAYVEVMNEPDWPLIDNGTTPPATVWQFHNTVADQIRGLNSDVQIGGYCTTFPNLEKNNFQEWQDQWRLFIDMCGTNMDFYSIHLYDFPVFGAQEWYRKGSNLEATFDMIEHYSHLQVGTALPFVISEYGAQTHNLNNQGWSAYRDWLKVKSTSSMLMSFMDRPNLMLKTIPFIVCKAEWGRGAVPYSSRLMRQANEPASYTGDWVYTEMVKFYQLWSDVKGTRVDSKPSDVDLQTDAYVNGNKAYLILNNLLTTTQTVDLNLFEDHGNTVQSVFEKNMYWNGSGIALDETTHPGTLAQVQLQSEGTAILEYTFANPVNINHTSDEEKHYATTYFQPIVAGQAKVFTIHGVGKGLFGEAVLRLGMGRAHLLSKQPVVLFNGTPLAVTPDFMGHEGDDRATFFGELDIPVPYSLLQPGNTISVTFPDTGGTISSVSLRAYAFSKDVRQVGTPGSIIYDAQVVGNDIVMAITNGVPMGSLDVLSSEDLLVPVENWATHQAGIQFDANGATMVTHPLVGEHAYYIVRENPGGGPPTNSVTATFDFSLPVNDWSGNVDAISTSGTYWFNNSQPSANKFIMQIGNPANGYLAMFHSGGAHGPHSITSAFTVQDAADSNQTFSVVSLNWANITGPTQAELLGYSGGTSGTLVWTLSGTPHSLSDPATTTATTGDLSAPIDTILWRTVGPTYLDDSWGASLDSLVLSIAAP